MTKIKHLHYVLLKTKFTEILSMLMIIIIANKTYDNDPCNIWGTFTFCDNEVDGREPKDTNDPHLQEESALLI
jgi:hypothetical protein